MIAFRGAVLPVVVWASLAASFSRAEERVVFGEPEKTEQWVQKLRMWQAWFDGRGKDPVVQTREAACAQIEAIDDPAAVPAIVGLLKSEKQWGGFRYILMRPLVKLGGDEAVAMLVKLSVEDKNPLLRKEAAEGLVGKQELPQHLDQYIKYLYKPQFSTAAAQALRWNKLAVRQSNTDPLDPKLTKALIAALVQKQKKRVPYWMAEDTGWIGHRDSNGGSGGRFRHREYKEGWVEVLVPQPNPEALQTLKEYSYGDYQYDQGKWLSAMQTPKVR